MKNIQTVNNFTLYGKELISLEGLQQVQNAINEIACIVPFSFLLRDEYGFGKLVGTDEYMNPMECFFSNPFLKIYMTLVPETDSMEISFKKTFLCKLSKKTNNYIDYIISNCHCAAEDAADDFLRSLV